MDPCRWLVIINVQILEMSTDSLWKLCNYSVLTPYYTEEVLFSLQALETQNEDGVSILFYLQKIFPGLFGLLACFCDQYISALIWFFCCCCIFLWAYHMMPWQCQLDEWENFLERVNCKNEEELRDNEELEEDLRLWASYRGQTLTRTGMYTWSRFHVSPL